LFLKLFPRGSGLTVCFGSSIKGLLVASLPVKLPDSGKRFGVAGLLDLFVASKRSGSLAEKLLVSK
jgi:hypothetical protein